MNHIEFQQLTALPTLQSIHAPDCDAFGMDPTLTRRRDRNSHHSGWQKVVRIAQALTQQLEDSPWSVDFGRDGASIRLRPATRSGDQAQAVSVHREHPDGRFDPDLSYWLRRSGQADVRLKSPEQAIEVLESLGLAIARTMHRTGH